MSDIAARTILAVDPGERRFGVAIADLETRFARPLEVVDVRKTDPVTRVVELARVHGSERVVVGKPVGLSGREGPAVESYRGFVERLRDAGVEVAEHDERLTTVIAEQGLRAGGAAPKARKEIRDAVAAQVLLQSYLDGEG
ncbi:MAG TPA: Holliday junction resolvase RuvX [Actinomycetota bacterium]|nr:Holliday junction resolvase RuvX [Actinomycetota bacterium]